LLSRPLAISIDLSGRFNCCSRLLKITESSHPKGLNIPFHSDQT
jgi:hypothetical protein